MELQRFGIVIALPAACALVGLALAGKPWRRVRPPDPRSGPHGWAWGGAIGFGAGFIVAFWQIRGWPAISPREGWLPYGPSAGEGWIPYLIALAALLGVANALVSAPAWSRILIRLVVSVAAAALILNWRMPRFWDSPDEIGAGLAAFGGAAFLLWTSLDALAERAEGAPLPVALWGACAGAAATIALARSAWIAEQFGALAACLGAAFVLALWRRDLSLARGAAPVIALAYASLLVDGYYSARYLLWPAALLLAAAPSAAWITQLRPIRRRGVLVRTLAALALTGGVVGAAALLVCLHRPAPDAFGC